MYCLLLLISLTLAAPRDSRNSFTLCDMQTSRPADALARDRIDSPSDLTKAKRFSREITLDDTGVYFVPAEEDLFPTYFTRQPFLISNPVTFKPRIKKGFGAEREFSGESNGRRDSFEVRESLIRVSNSASQLPSYLDLEIRDVTDIRELSVSRGNFIPTFESAEQALVECLDLHILDFTRKYGSVEYFNEFWEARNLKLYEYLSNDDLNDKIKQYCSETEFIIEQSLQDIMRGVPKKKTNFRFIHDDEDDMNTKEAKEADVPDKHNLITIDNHYGSSSFLDLYQTTDPSDSPKNNTMVYYNEFDMDTMPSEIVFRTNKEVNKFDIETVNNNSIMDDTASLPVSTPSFNDVSSFDTTNETIEKPSTENQDEHNFDAWTGWRFGNNLKINNNTKTTVNETTTSEVISTMDDTTVSASLPTLSGNKLLDVVRINTEKPIAITKENTRESVELDNITMPSENIPEENLKLRQSNERIFDRITIHPASTKPKYEEVTLGELISDAEASTNQEHKPRKYEVKETTLKQNLSCPSCEILDKNQFLDNLSLFSGSPTPQNDKLGNIPQNGDKNAKLDHNTTPSAIILKSSNGIFKSHVNVSGIEPKMDEIAYLPAAPKPVLSEKHAFKYTNSNSTTKPKGKIESQGIDLDTNISSKVNMTTGSTHPFSDSTRFFPASTTLQSEKLALGETNSNLDIIEKGDDKNISDQFYFDKSPKIIEPKYDTLSKPTFDETTYASERLELPKNVNLPLYSSSNGSRRSMFDNKENLADIDTSLDLDPVASSVILNIASDRTNTHTDGNRDEIVYFTTTSNSPLHGNAFSHKNTDFKTNDDSPDLSTTPAIDTDSHRENLKESDVKIPKIITKECQNNEVQSFISGNEALPNNDFDNLNSDLKIKANHITYPELNTDSTVEDIARTAVSNSSFINGHLYFKSNQELVPVRVLQTESGISIGIDGLSFCEKLLRKTSNKSLLLSSLCDCIHKTLSNNSTDTS